MKAPVPLEKEIQASICAYLFDIKHYFGGRMNTQPIFNRAAGAYRAMPKYSLNGFPDIFLLKDGTFIGLEVKRPGGKQSDVQVAFEHNCLKNGIKYYVVTSIEDVQKLGL